ncbi:MAG TPA: pyridoxal-dependent decarboxylase, exosortase A system-associated [Nitrococcus sp.]|nr:pyridoxal-dependent decarboxylase, exosortase A system-associated [Nitrococcus sp.]
MSTTIIKTHPALANFTVVDDCLQIGGMALTELAARVGRTPFYAYDRRLLDTRMAELRAALPDEIAIHYALKANPMPALVAHMAGLADGMDVASGGELKIALDAGVPASDISFAGPGKQVPELCAAVASGITINLESFLELDRITDISQGLGIAARVAVRINPDFELKASGMKMGGGPKVFGVDAEATPELLRRIGQRGHHFTGFHIYTGSQNLRAAAICEAQAKSFQLAYRMAEHTPAPLRELNIGGGFGIPYFPGEEPLDLAPIGEGLAEHLHTVRDRLGATQVIIELGRYLVGEAGIYVAEVVDRKQSRGHVFVVTNGGLHHHLAASGNFGQVLRKNYPVVVGNRVLGNKREQATITGPLCTPLDLLAEKIEIARAEPGDLVVVFQSGAYGLSASPRGFLSHPEPVEALV